MTSKAVERAVALLDVLSSRRYGLDREQIRERIPGYAGAKSDAAFERMFERDKDALRALGVELVSERAPQSPVGFVYRLLLPPERQISFSPLDLVLLSHLSSAWDGTDLERLARSAILKIGAQTGKKLTGHLGEPARFSDVGGLAECLEATAEGKGVSFSYGGTAKEVRKVSCWGLGLRFGHWYLYGWDRVRRAERTFRLDRMRSVKIIPPVPAGTGQDFSMGAALDRVGTRDIPRVASRALGADKPGLQLAPSYSPQESAVAAIVAGRTHRLGALELPAEADRAQQTAVEAAEGRLRTTLLGALGRIAPAEPVIDWKLPVAQRVRESAAEQLTRTVLMLSLVSDAGSLGLKELADFFEVPVSKVKDDLDAVASSVEFGSLTVDIDGQQRVTVRGIAALTGGAALTASEAAVLILAIELGQSAGNQLVFDRLTLKVLEAVPAPGALAGRFSVYSQDTNEQIAGAIERRIPLTIRYSSYRGETERTVEPLALVINDGPRYLRAWCRDSGGLRNFRLDRITYLEQLTGQSFPPRAESAEETPESWLRNLAGEPHRLAVLALSNRAEKSLVEAAQRKLERYAVATASRQEERLYRVPVVNEGWLLELLLSLDGVVALLSPPPLRERLLERVSGGADAPSM